jgi:hypothetical protein
LRCTQTPQVPHNFPMKQIAIFGSKPLLDNCIIWLAL